MKYFDFEIEGFNLKNYNTKSETKNIVKKREVYNSNYIPFTYNDLLRKVLYKLQRNNKNIGLFYSLKIKNSWELVVALEIKNKYNKDLDIYAIIHTSCQCVTRVTREYGNDSVKLGVIFSNENKSYYKYEKKFYRTVNLFDNLVDYINNLANVYSNKLDIEWLIKDTLQLKKPFKIDKDIYNITRTIYSMCTYGNYGNVSIIFKSPILTKKGVELKAVLLYPDYKLEFNNNYLLVKPKHNDDELKILFSNIRSIRR